MRNYITFIVLLACSMGFWFLMCGGMLGGPNLGIKGLIALGEAIHGPVEE